LIPGSLIANDFPAVSHGFTADPVHKAGDSNPPQVIDFTNGKKTLLNQTTIKQVLRDLPSVFFEHETRRLEAHRRQIALQKQRALLSAKIKILLTTRILQTNQSARNVLHQTLQVEDEKPGNQPSLPTIQKHPEPTLIPLPSRCRIFVGTQVKGG